MIIKDWGNDRILYHNQNIQINEIQINYHGESSKHYHNDKNNIFYVISGKLLIKIWNNDIVTEYVLSSKDTIEIPSKTYHKFHALEDTVALEIYYLNKALDINDIVRN